MDERVMDQLPASGRVLLFCFLLAALAGLFSALRAKLKLPEALIAAGTSGVGGLVVGAVCMHVLGPDYWYITCAACGLAGWAGGEVVLDRLAGVAWTIVKGKLPQSTGQDQKPR